jgi:hypothetical protein
MQDGPDGPEGMFLDKSTTIQVDKTETQDQLPFIFTHIFTTWALSPSPCPQKKSILGKGQDLD